MPIYDPVIITRAEVVNVAKTARVDGFCKLEGGLGIDIGEYVHVASFCHLNVGGGELVLEDYSAVASSTVIITGSNMMDAITLSAAAPKEMQHIERSKVVVKKYATIYAHATILPGVTIGEGAIVAAGAVVTKDVEPWTVVAGVPATFLRKRELSEQWKVQAR